MNHLESQIFTVLALTSILVAVHGQPKQTPAYSLQEDSAQVGEMDQQFRRYGQGPPLLLIHGLTNTWRVWRPHLKSLGASHGLLIPDIRGHGDTSNPDSSLTSMQVAQDMFSLLDALGVDRVQIAGYSFGGHVALRMAALQPERVEAIVVIAGAHRLIDSAVKYHKEALQSEIPAGWWLTEVSTWHPGGENQVRSLWRQGIESALTEDFSMSEESLAAIRARTLIIQGDRDEVFPLEVPIDLYRRIKGSQLWIIPNTSHIAVFWEDVLPADETYGGNSDANRLFPEIVNTFLGP